MNAMLTTAVPLPAILDQPASDVRARRHHIGDFDLGAADLDRFNTLLIRLGRNAPLDRDRVATAARELRAGAKDAFEPACIQQRMVRLQAAANMIGDMQWTTPDDAGNAAELIVHYALGQEQLLPNTLPTVGRLDDAIAIDAAWPKLHAEVDAFIDYVRLRSLEAELRGRDPSQFAFSRSDWEEARVAEAQLEQQRRAVRESSYLPATAPLFSIH